ncbi:hypothetical protein STEG23_024281 [Scotinomys teguina]
MESEGTEDGDETESIGELRRVNLMLCELAGGDGVSLAEIQRLIGEKVEKHFSLQTLVAREQEQTAALSNREVFFRKMRNNFNDLRNASDTKLYI